LEWSCTCFASAGPFDARIDTSDANNYTSNANDCTTSNGKAITNALSDDDDGTHANADDGSTHEDALAIPYTVSLPDGNANAVIVANDGTHPDPNALPDGDANANDGA